MKYSSGQALTSARSSDASIRFESARLVHASSEIFAPQAPQVRAPIRVPLGARGLAIAVMDLLHLSGHLQRATRTRRNDLRRPELSRAPLLALELGAVVSGAHDEDRR
jgi:hypothetical protein